MSNQSVDFAPCGPLGSGECFFAAQRGPQICNETEGTLVREPTGSCDYFICGYDEISSESTTVLEDAVVCSHGSYTSSATSFKSKPLGLWTTILMAMTILPSVVRALPAALQYEQPRNVSRRALVATSGFERTANVDWTSVESQLHGKAPGAATTIGRSRYTLLSHESDPAPDSIGKNILAARQLEGVPAYDTVYQENVDRTDRLTDCPQVQSNCIESGLSSAGGSVTFGTSYDRSFSIDFGIDVGSAATFADIITNNAGLNLGFTWHENVNCQGSDSCNVNQDVEVAQLFWRPIFGTADTATRTCQVSPIYGELYCTDWVFGHIEYPLRSGGLPARISGCSAGWDNVHCLDAIGTQKCGEDDNIEW